jgi:hypothetical protein
VLIVYYLSARKTARLKRHYSEDFIAKSLWKLGWLLRDFLYDPETLGRERITRSQNQLLHYQWGLPCLHFDESGQASQREELSFPS